jgi:hypothetical protein
MALTEGIEPSECKCQLLLMPPGPPAVLAYKNLDSENLKKS